MIERLAPNCGSTAATILTRFERFNGFTQLADLNASFQEMAMPYVFFGAAVIAILK
jgi:hypothetical protein